MGEAAAPNLRCTPILYVFSLFQVVLGCTRVVYADDLGRESLFGFLLVSSMEQVMGMFCMGRRGEGAEWCFTFM